MKSVTSLITILLLFSLTAEGRMRSDGSGGYWTDDGHVRSDGSGGFWLPDGGHQRSDGSGGFWDN